MLRHVTGPEFGRPPARLVRRGMWRHCLYVHVFIRSPPVFCREVFLGGDQRRRLAARHVPDIPGHQRCRKMAS